MNRLIFALLLICASSPLYSNEKTADRFFDVLVSFPHTPVDKIDHEFIEISLMDKKIHILEDLRNKHNLSDSELHKSFYLSSKHLKLNNEIFAIITTYWIKSGIKDYKIAGLANELVSIECFGKKVSDKSIVDTACGEAIKKHLNIDSKNQVESFFSQEINSRRSQKTQNKRTSKLLNQVDRKELQAALDEFRRVLETSSKQKSAKNLLPEKSGKANSDTFFSEGQFRFENTGAARYQHCIDLTDWESRRLKRSEAAVLSKNLPVEKNSNNTLIQLYCKKNRMHKCDKNSKWLSENELFSLLLNKPFKRQEVVASSHSTGIRNGQKYHKLCFNFKKERLNVHK